MSFRYIIEGNVITREELVTTKMVTLAGLLPNLTSYIPVELSPLPKNCRYLKVAPLDNMGLQTRIIVEHTPMLVRINHKDAPARVTREATNYRLMMPYGFFWFNLKGNRMVTPTSEAIIWTPEQWGYLWSNEPYSTLTTTTVWGARLPNCWSNGTVCFGSTSVTANQQLGHFIDAAINTFWTSEFNNDLSVHYPYASLSDWEVASTADPDGWRQWRMWTSGGQTVKAMLDALDSMTWEEPIPSSADSPIPALQIQPTFYHVRNWLESLSENDRARLREAMNDVE